MKPFALARFIRSSLTPPPPASGEDAEFARVISLLHCDGVDAATSTTDIISGKTWTLSGSAQLDTATKEYGTAGLLVPGSGRAISNTDSSDAFGTGDYCIEFSFRPNSFSGQMILCDTRSSSTQPAACIYSFLGELRVYIDGADRISGGYPSTGSYIKFRLSRVGNRTKLFVNGSQVGSTFTDNLNYTNDRICWGDASYTTGNSVDGTFDECRVTKGSGRNEGNYAVATAAFPDAGPAATDIYWNNVVALLHMDGADASTTWTDATGKTWTGAGVAEIDTAVSKFGGAAGYFSTNGRISTPTNSDFNFGTGDFTIEWWQWWDSNGIYQNPFSMGYNATGGIFVQNNANGRYSLYTSLANLIGTEPVGANTNQWYHYAVTRQNGVGRIYRDGVETVSGTMTDSITGAQPFYIGADDAGSYGVRGWIDDFRVTKGVCRYPNGTTFTPPAAAFAEGQTTDPDFASVTALLHFDGADAATTIIDQTGRAWTAVGSAQLDTAQARFGATSVNFPSAGSVITGADDAGLRMGAGDFTIEFFLRFNSISGAQTIMSKGYGRGNGWILQTGSGDGKLNFYVGAGTTVCADTAGMSAGLWYHIAIVRSGSAVTIYRDGLASSTGTSSLDLASSVTPMVIGGGNSFDNYSAFNVDGWIDELRVTKGVARYTATFTPPAQPLPNF